MMQNQAELTREARAEALQRIQSDGVYFVEDVMGFTLWEKQREIIRSVSQNKRTAVRSCHNVGKSYTAARVAIHFLFTHPDSIVMTTAPTMRQVRDILWRELRTAYYNSAAALGGEILQTRLNINDRWYAVGLSPKEPNHFQGGHAENILIIVDEAAGVEEDIFEAIDSSLSNVGARLLLIGNPTSLAGTFYYAFRSSVYHGIAISAFDTPNFTKFGITIDDIINDTWEDKITSEMPMPFLISPDWAREMYEKNGLESPMFQARVMGDFPDQTTDSLIPLNKIEAAVQRDLPVGESSAKTIGVDVAHYGTNKTVFLAREGDKVIDIQKMTLQDTVTTSGKLVRFMDKHGNPPTYVDYDGIGAGVVDNMRHNKHFNVKGVKVGRPSSDKEQWINLRAQWYWLIRERFINGQIDIPDDPELVAELANIKYDYNTRGAISIESKEKMASRGVSSPDIADALILAYRPKPQGGVEAPKRAGAKPITAGLRKKRF